ncbi:hypothetical protein HK104_004680, partial [Borealophlyctis nickersoniae]
MSDCAPYVSACNNPANASAACGTNPPLPSLPSTTQVAKQIGSICTEMDMSGCDKCKLPPGATYADCDLLGTYSSLCKSMPGMSQCAEWKSMCSTTPTLGYCAQDASVDPPVMKMYFHGGISDYVLMESWVPRTGAHYAAAWVSTFLLSILYEATSAAQFVVEDRRARMELSSSTLPSWSHTIIAGILRGLVRIWMASLAYILMLIVMTYNVGLFFAAVVGLGVGAAVFGGVAKRAAVRAGLDGKNE